MNRSALKTYAPQARRDFIQAMKDRAAFFGISAKSIEPMLVKGDAVVIGGKEYPKEIAGKRQLLEERIQKDGFNQTMEAVAYTWFNRFVALRYMELHQYLEHGYRVLSHPDEKETPEILEHAQHLELAGLNQELVFELKLDGNKENQLYRLILIAQCNALHGAMPFLFERIDDETELLLPENLLNSDSLIRKLVNGIEEEDWEKVEILGWLYQFYISEKKDEVIGKVVASEDIPAATQLFTPNWIVRYLVQNTLGRQWLATYPDSPIRAQMEFYIEPAEQEPEVQEQLKAITPTILNPEEITFLDPAAGSGHILVEAYDLFKAIYLERAYRPRDVPRLILEKNLFGLEIDDRAAQLAAFALMMKARADDRRIFDGMVQPSIVCFVESKGMNPSDLTQALNTDISEIGEGKIPESDIAELVILFDNAKTFGSLIQISNTMKQKIDKIMERYLHILKSNSLMIAIMKPLYDLINQSKILARKYNCVVANPPYLGAKSMTNQFKNFAKLNFPDSKSDTFSIFIEQGIYFAKQNGYNGMVTMQSWMFLASYQNLRFKMIKNQILICMAHMGPRSFDSISGDVVQTTAFINLNHTSLPYKSYFYRLTDGKNEIEKAIKCKEAIDNKDCGWCFNAKADEFKRLPGAPIAYWISNAVFEVFSKGKPFSAFADARKGMVTRDNNVFIRSWSEVAICRIGLGLNSRSEAVASGKRWFPYQKGGEFRKWYGNHDWVVDWENDGYRLLHMEQLGYSGGSTNHNLDYIFHSSLIWSKISSGTPCFRLSPNGFLFDDASGLCAIRSYMHLNFILGFLCSNVCYKLLMIINPTLNIQPGNMDVLPVIDVSNMIDGIVEEAIGLSKHDWDCSETSWDFKTLPILQYKFTKIQTSQENADVACLKHFNHMKDLEKQNNLFFIQTYGFQNELSPDVPDEQITLHRPNREEDIKRLISYAIGCTMGRYSLDKEGLIYANANNEGFDPTQYKTFPADDDGIVPLLNQDWGIRDDATDRFVKFISVAWAEEHLEENLKFVSESIGGSPDDNPREVIRNYFSTGFYKFHLQMYKRRPIYWLFSSGKQKAFQALVYLHRYNEGTLSRMRTEYVIPLQGKIAGRIEQLEGDKLKATSTSHRKKLQKEQDDLKKQQKELLDFDEKLKHFADQRIKLDLDDGVKVNYGKFGDLLAEVKAVTGGTDE